ncbi:MAG: hypothetical protein JWM76_2834, partial [Pseudonocardiales bacterium]|nr:hypothetical protein [Pseudonocardiales bacterium]
MTDDSRLDLPGPIREHLDVSSLSSLWRLLRYRLEANGH